MDEKELVQNYIELRDALAAGKKKFESWQGEKKAVMEKIEAALMKKLDAMGAESVRTEAGTFFKETQRSLTVGDGTIFFEWCMKNDFGEMLEKRPSKAAVLEWADEHGSLPPGLNLRQELTVRIRRS